jgi:hypothetical protein
VPPGQNTGRRFLRRPEDTLHEMQPAGDKLGNSAANRHENEADAAAADRSARPVWVGRVGQAEPRADYSHLTPSQWIALCWEVTKQAWALIGATFDESALCRNSERISQRGR